MQLVEATKGTYLIVAADKALLLNEVIFRRWCPGALKIDSSNTNNVPSRALISKFWRIYNL
jgi:hypothetical protein